MTAKEALNNVCYVYGFDDNIVVLENAINRLDELGKVLKIIKEKQVMLPIFMTICAFYGNEALKEYNSMVGKGRKLTETEFNLLKEYLK